MVLYSVAVSQTCKWLDEMQQKQRAKEREVSQTAECSSLLVETVEQWQREQSALLQEVNARSRSVELLESTLRRRISKCTCTATASAPPIATVTASASARSSTSSLVPAATTCVPVANNSTSTSTGTSATTPKNACSPSQSLSPPLVPLTLTTSTSASAGGLLLMAIPPIPEESEPPESATSLMGLGDSGLGHPERTSSNASPVREGAAGKGTQPAEKAQGADDRLTALSEQLNQLLSRWTAVWDLSHKLKRRLDLYHSHLSEACPRPHVHI